ncbi:MAG TPA: TonB-dependent vitamin B12 receptor [Woeseiaceae bacterium]|nr:TonB-dependent vitamin B12 receptor [Woeseiaceae bacterium]
MRLFGFFPAFLLLSPAASQAQDETLPTFVVTATRTSETAGESLASVTLITREDIERQQARSVQDVLRGVAGVQISSSGGFGKSTSIFLRGTNEDQVLVLVDGIKVGSATLGTTAIENLPLEQVERIEVVRGPRSSLYGSEAIGGVIHIMTRRGAGPVSTSLVIGGGSSSTRHAAAGLSGGDAGFWFNLSASRLKSGGFDVRDSAAEPDADGYENTALSLRAGRRFGNSVEAEVHVLHSDGFTEFDGDFVNEADLLQQVFGARLTFDPAAFWRVRILAGRSRDEQDNFKDGAARTRFDTDRDTLSFLNELSIGDAQVLTLGVDLQRDRIDSTTEYSESERRITGTFAQLATAAGRHDLLFAARLDDNEQFGNEVTGSAAWGWTPVAGIRLRASFGTAFKAPSLNQLYFPGFGNPALEPERSRSAEIGARAATQGGTVSIAAYHTDVDDLILFDPVTFFPENVSQARIRGVELGYSLHLDAWQVSAALDLLAPENRSSGTDRGNLLPRRARQSLSIEAHRELERARLGARLTAEGSRFDDLANRQRLSGYATLDLLGEYTVHRHWRLQLRIENLFDRHYQTAASFNQPGRGVFLTLRYTPEWPDAKESPPLQKKENTP